MPKAKQLTGRAAIVDDDETAWRAEYHRRLVHPDPQEVPPLPTWTASEHVTRELLGRFIENRETGVVHDVRNATPACDVDGIARGTFYHFISEVPASLTDCAHCIGAER
jgi:hypothetical protein